MIRRYISSSESVLVLSILTVFGISSLTISGIFSFVEADEVVDTITVGDFPTGIAYNKDNTYVYLSNQGDKTVSIIDGSVNEVVDTINVGNFQILSEPLRVVIENAYSRNLDPHLWDNIFSR